MSRNPAKQSPSRQRFVERQAARDLGPQTGYIVSLYKEYGFIEVNGDSDDVYFHLSRVDLDSRELRINDRVEYWLDTMVPRPRALRVRKLPP